MRKRTIILSLVIIALFISSVGFAAAKNPYAKKRFDLKDEIKPLAPPSGGKAKPSKAQVGCEIVIPIEGSTISQGTTRILVSATARAGVSRVEVKVDGPEATGWVDITSNYDGTYYYHDWTVTTDGQYTISAMVTAEGGKTKKDEAVVYVGEKPPQKWALLIGIADYRGSSSDLWHPDEDALEMKAELLEYGYPEANIKVLLNKKATASAISAAIDWLISNESPGDEVVFFYSGHGCRVSDDWDSDIEADGLDEGIVSHDLYGITDGYLKTKFAAVESTDFALLFGSCHSGGMFDDNDDLQGSGRVIAAACAADQYGWDYLYLDNTLWGYWFVDMGLLQNNADSVEAAHVYAFPQVVLEQPDSQPQLYDSYEGDYGI